MLSCGMWRCGEADLDGNAGRQKESERACRAGSQPRSLCVLCLCGLNGLLLEPQQLRVGLHVCEPVRQRTRHGQKRPPRSGKSLRKECRGARREALGYKFSGGSLSSFQCVWRALGRAGPDSNLTWILQFLRFGFTAQRSQCVVCG